MEIAIKKKGGAVHMRLDGEIDLHVSPNLREALQKLVADRTEALVMDFSGVDYIDSSGLATLIEYIREAGEHGGKLVLCGLKPRVKMVFELVRLHELFTIVPTCDEALERLATPSAR